MFAGYEGLVLLLVFQFSSWSSFKVMQFGAENPRGKRHVLHLPLRLCFPVVAAGVYRQER